MRINDINLGEIILNLLTEKGISKGEFADNLGIKRQNVNRDVFDKKSLDTSLVKKISEYLDCNLFKLFVADNQIDYTKKELKTTIAIEMGNKKKDITFRVLFGENDLKIIEQ